MRNEHNIYKRQLKKPDQNFTIEFSQIQATRWVRVKSIHSQFPSLSAKKPTRFSPEAGMTRADKNIFSCRKLHTLIFSAFAARTQLHLAGMVYR